MFPINSRYLNTSTAEYETASGKKHVYLRRRMLPPPENFDTIHEHMVVQGDRLDNIAARYFGDPELFWRIADANRAMHPSELTETVGRRLRITMPEGIPGIPHA